MGVVPWILANSDLKKIRNGIMSDDKIAYIKFGKIFGIAGVFFFCLILIFGLLAAKREFGKLPNLLSTEPIPAECIAYVGDWTGDNGSVIVIYQTGRADFKTKNKSVSGGWVHFDGNEMTIGLLGLKNSWKIEQPPAFENGSWRMQLNGEVFRKEAIGTETI
jgi:hypothetical protein